MDAQLTGEICTCTYCEHYADTYERIATSGRARWLTIAPPSTHNDAITDYKLWMSQLTKIKDFADFLILIAEISPQMRLHFHVLYSSKDKPKEYRYINGWRYDAMVRIYNGTPKEGKHYLFKDIASTQEVLPDASIIFDRQHLLGYERSLKTNLKRVQQHEDLGILEYLTDNYFLTK